MSHRYFENPTHSSLYSRVRPSPSAHVIQDTIQYLSEKNAPHSNGKWQLAVDVGTGTGQGVKVLQPYFEKIIGLDVSESQISEANRCNPFSNVEFKVSAAESLPVADASVDLLTACQCMHWFDIPAFLNEARRVLKLNGVLMVSRYTVPFLYTTNKESIPIINLIYDTYRSGVLQKYFNMDRLQYFDSGYAQVEFPFSDVSRRKTFMDEVVAGESCIDDVQSWSGFQILLQKEPSVAATVLADLRKNIISYFGENELSKIQLTFRREVDLVLCRK